MRSMGFTSNALLAMLLGESVILSTLGGLSVCAGSAYLVLKFGFACIQHQHHTYAAAADRVRHRVISGDGHRLRNHPRPFDRAQQYR